VRRAELPASVLTNEPSGLPDIETNANSRNLRVGRLFDRFGSIGAFKFSSRAHVLGMI
jgi:hypothetical protein